MVARPSAGVLILETGLFLLAGLAILPRESVKAVMRAAGQTASLSR